MTRRRRAWIRALPILANQGLVLDADRVEVGALAAYARCQGWQHSTEPTGQPFPTRRWRATVLMRQASHGYLSGTHGHGATEEEALAIALASMIRRTEPRDATGGASNGGEE
jgi:hypothetical protein